MYNNQQNSHEPIIPDVYSPYPDIKDRYYRNTFLCCCSSKSKKGDPRSFVDAYFTTNMVFGFLTAGYPFNDVWIYGLANLVTCIIGKIMLRKGGKNTVLLVRLCVIASFFLNFAGIFSTGLLFVLLFLIFAALLGGGAFLDNLETEFEILDKITTAISKYVTYFGYFVGLIGLLFLWLWLVVTVQACKCCSVLSLSLIHI